MSESGDFKPAAHWAGHDFTSNRRAYAGHAARSYDDAKQKKLTIKQVLPDELVCDAEVPILIMIDETGSMQDWPATIISKFPYLEHETSEYFGENWAICFGGIGDAYNGETYPVQAKPFMRKSDFEKAADEIKQGKWMPVILENGGGGTGEESYDLGALYIARSVKTPNAIRKPLLIIIGDEGIYPTVSKELAKKYLNITLESDIPSEQIFEELCAKFSVYIVRKPYGGENAPSNMKVQNQWIRMLGEDRVMSLPTADRVVDVIFGIFAKETNRVDYFHKELNDRQLKDHDGKAKIDVVLKSLHTIHAKDVSRKKIEGPIGSAVSMTRRTGHGGTKSISLMDDED